MEIRVYNPEVKNEWDKFVRESRNGTFLFCRDFMDYHADRFTDCSFMFYKENKLVALMPGNISEKTYYSHQGLTYGGLIMDKKLYAADVLVIFAILLSALKKQGVEMFVYKAIPHIYHSLPAEEDLYALFRNNARLMVRNISSAILSRQQLQYTDLRKRGVSKARRMGMQVRRNADIQTFWEILTQNLRMRHNTNPVHSIVEITKLMNIFPDNIELYTVDYQGEIYAGVVMFVTGQVAHVQYVAGISEGQNQGATDFLIDFLIKKYSDKAYFDFGISTEKEGTYLNEGLIHQKEGFGARAVNYDTYLINL